MGSSKGISERTLRDWLKEGLRASRLPSGTVLISYQAIDEYLKRFEIDPAAEGHKVDRLVDELLEGLQK